MLVKSARLEVHSRTKLQEAGWASNERVAFGVVNGVVNVDLELLYDQFEVILDSFSKEVSVSLNGENENAWDSTTIARIRREYNYTTSGSDFKNGVSFPLPEGHLIKIFNSLDTLDILFLSPDNSFPDGAVGLFGEKMHDGFGVWRVS